MCLAGLEAQRRFSPKSRGTVGARSDYDQAVRVMDHFVGSNEELEAYIELLKIRARQLVRHPALSKCIEALAAKLAASGSLSREEAMKEIRGAYAPVQPQSASSL